MPKKIRGLQKISDQEIVELAKLAVKLQKHYYFPQDSRVGKRKRETLYCSNKASYYNCRNDKN